MGRNTVYCGIDHGTKRIGLAVSNPEGTIASPVSAVDARGPADQVILRVIQAVGGFDIDEWVVGLPLNMDGTEGEQAAHARRFGRHLAQATEKPVHYWDERLSSESATDRLAQANLTHKKKKARRDAVAAQVILQSFLDAQSG